MQTKAQKRRGALARMAESIERGARTDRFRSSITMPAEELRSAAVNGSDETVIRVIREAEQSRNRSISWRGAR